MTDSRSLARGGLTLSERQVFLFLGDAVCVIAAIAVALVLWVFIGRGTADPVTFLQERNTLSPFLLFAPLWFLLIAHLYDPHSAYSRERTVVGLVLAAGISLLVYLAWYFLNTRGALPRVPVLLFLAAVFALELGWRTLATQLFTLPALQRPTLIIGGGRAGRMILGVLQGEVAGHFRVDGFVDDDPAKKSAAIDGVKVLGGWQALKDIVRENRISLLVLAIAGEIRPELFQAILDCQEQGAEVIRMPTLYESLLGRVPIDYLEADWLLNSFLDSARLYDLYSPLKRLMDLLVGVIGVAFWMVTMPFFGLVIRLDSAGPILFGQTRSGRGGRPIWVWKYRTMVADAEADGKPRWASEEDPRVTRVGKWLRRTRLDEVPQFWNVLRGEMSFIGPRPERPEWIAKLEQTIPFYRARLLVRPGITGWSQVNYGYVRSVEDTALKLEYDLYYIRHLSFGMDAKIMLRTLGTILRFQGS